MDTVSLQKALDDMIRTNKPLWGNAVQQDSPMIFKFLASSAGRCLTDELSIAYPYSGRICLA